MRLAHKASFIKRLYTIPTKAAIRHLTGISGGNPLPHQCFKHQHKCLATSPGCIGQIFFPRVLTEAFSIFFD